MDLPSLTLALLGASLALSAAVALVLLRDATLDRVLRWTALGVVAAGAAHSGVAGPAGDAWPPALQLGLRIAAALGVVALWSLAHQLFDPRPAARPAWRGPLAIGAAGVVLPLLLAAALPALRGTMQGVVALAVGGLVAEMLWLLVAGRRDDLDPQRRALRLLLAGVAALYIAVVLWAHFDAWRSTQPLATALWTGAAQIAIKLAWLLLVLGRPSPLQRLQATTQRADPPPTRALTAPTGSGPAGTAAALAARQAAQILAAMEGERLYRRPGLGIGELAEHLRLPEHRVRSVVNGHLGFRNYTAFVNHFRLREVAARLRSPDDAHLPILTIALEAGYASIGPFNRAFRDAYGMTPTDYRRAPASPAPAESPA
jgi:AraC-like DNA-binding protein